VNNGFGAEYGRALGGIVNIVTKSGTNNFHGSAYDYLQNNATDARSLLQPAPQGDTLQQNQFGGTLGGPIKTDKTFFFADYEKQRRGESPTYPSTLVGPVGLSNGTQSTELALINQAKVALGLPPENLNIETTKNTDNGLIKIDKQFGKNNPCRFDTTSLTAVKRICWSVTRWMEEALERPAAVTMHTFGIKLLWESSIRRFLPIW
jgi:outer membrane receptor for ferrienterochelin and colicin